MKKILNLVILISLLTACSAPKLYQQGVKKIEKAIKKDPSIKMPTDTVIDEKIVTEYDSVTKTITITKEVVKTVNNCDFDTTLIETRAEKRWAYKLKRQSQINERRLNELNAKQNKRDAKYKADLDEQRVKSEQKIKELEIKLANKTEQKKDKLESGKSLWWMWMIFGALITTIVILFIQKKLPNMSIINPFRHGT